MRNVFLGLLLIASPAFGQTEGRCQGNTLQINDCMAADLQVEETELKLAYGRVMKELSKPDDAFTSYSKTKKKLLEAQRAWIRFRKTSCDAVYEFSAGGSSQNMRYLACMRDHANLRTKELKAQYLNE
jgi:uncharacterized protein YecT (DUF1311 family)